MEELEAKLTSNEENAVFSDDEKIAYTDSTYEIISKVAYLIGVPRRIFENDHESPKLEIFEHLEKDKNARIIRNLCVVRSAIQRNFRSINNIMKSEYRSILSIPEYVPSDSIMQLSNDGISFVKKSSTQLNHHLIELNRIISDRINNCRSIFPLWLNWQYVRELFIMPNGLSESGTKAAAALYYSSKQRYPYQMYINWRPSNEGNILYNDKKFISLLYRWHNDRFSEHSKVSDAGSYIKDNIYDFISESQKIVVVVDCENSDPYKLCSTLRNLDYEYTKKISSIILFDDIHTEPAWRILENYTKIFVKHMLIDRVKQNKSLVDISLTAQACTEHYQNNVDSFIIVSSDSDYWALIKALPNARFLVMIERERCGPDLKNALTCEGIFYCYIDDFYSGNTDDIKHGTLFKEMYRYIESTVNLNVNDMLDKALRTTRIEMTPAEKQQFYDKYIKTMQMSINPEGDVVLDFKRR